MFIRTLSNATVEEVRLVYQDRLVADHRRSWDRERIFFEPIHFPAFIAPAGLRLQTVIDFAGMHFLVHSNIEQKQ